jgi:hypothetical protein
MAVALTRRMVPTNGTTLHVVSAARDSPSC